MRVKIAHFINQLRHSFWFIPTLMTLVGVLAALGLHYLDVLLAGEFDWKLTDAAGARVIMTTVAGSSITVAGLVFSITMVVLSMSSSQYGPRLMKNFIRHSITKWVLGGYIGTFVYCLIITATIRDEYNGGWVPQISVSLGGLLGVISFGLLIIFIHHVASFMQAPRLIDDATSKLFQTAQCLFPLSALSKENRKYIGAGTLPTIDSEGEKIHCSREGYLQAVTLDAVLEKATKFESVVFFHFKPGEFILSGECVATVWNAEKSWPTVEEDINASLIVGIDRTDDQDVEYAIDQLVEIAVRALSPGINDPFTAINCIKRLAGVMIKLAEGLPPGLINDEAGQLRVATQTYSFDCLFDAAWHQLRQNSRGVEAVAITQMEYFTRLSKVEANPMYHSALQRHASLLYDDLKRSFTTPQDFTFVEKLYLDAFGEKNAKG